MAPAIRCLGCGAPIGRYRATCPRCGMTQPHKRMGSTIGLAILVAGLVLWTIYAVVTGGG